MNESNFKCYCKKTFFHLLLSHKHRTENNLDQNQFRKPSYRYHDLDDWELSQTSESFFLMCPSGLPYSWDIWNSLWFFPQIMKNFKMCVLHTTLFLSNSTQSLPQDLLKPNSVVKSSQSTVRAVETFWRGTSLMIF